MDADDRAGTSPEHFDRLACGVLSAARAAARELEREPQDADRRTWALGKLAGQAQAMLGPGLPDHPPVGAAAQEGFVRTALALAVHVRAHSWSERDLGAVGVPGQEDVPHPGERRSADAFDVLGRLMLPHALPEGWTATLVTDLARGDKTLEVAVKVGKYILHPTFLALTDDATRIIGEALHNINVDRLHELTRALRHYASAAEPSHPASKAEPTQTLTYRCLGPAARSRRRRNPPTRSAASSIPVGRRPVEGRIPNRFPPTLRLRHLRSPRAIRALRPIRECEVFQEPQGSRAPPSRPPLPIQPPRGGLATRSRTQTSRKATSGISTRIPRPRSNLVWIRSWQSWRHAGKRCPTSWRPSPTWNRATSWTRGLSRTVRPSATASSSRARTSQDSRTAIRAPTRRV